MRIIECKPGFPGMCGQDEVKVPGKVYHPRVEAIPAVEPSFIVSMTQEELNLLAALTGNASIVSSVLVTHIWQTLRNQVRSNRFVVTGEYTVRRAIER